MNDWNPELYMQFRSERTQPSIDLVSKIACAEPKSVIDIGCGPGNSTQVLVNRWPGARIVGLDNSASMIEKARADYPGQKWLIADAATYQSEVKYDIVFSNAVIQWLPDHEKLLTTLSALLSDTGILAVQVPQFFDMALGKIIRSVAGADRWKPQFSDVSEIFTMHKYPFYYDQLSDDFRSIEMWKTDYMHVLDSHEAIMEMMRGTGLRPYHEKLDTDAEKTEFEADVLNNVVQAYPEQKDGTVILPFKRLFFVGYR